MLLEAQDGFILILHIYYFCVLCECLFIRIETLGEGGMNGVDINFLLG